MPTLRMIRYPARGENSKEKKKKKLKRTQKKKRRKKSGMEMLAKWLTSKFRSDKVRVLHTFTTCFHVLMNSVRRNCIQDTHTHNYNHLSTYQFSYWVVKISCWKNIIRLILIQVGLNDSLNWLPDPIFISPLCWIKMVSHVKLPWTMGGEQECK